MNYTEKYTDPSTVAVGVTETLPCQVVTRELASSADAYMMRLLQLGAMEGSLSDMDINPLLKPLLEAIHHVLAGGSVEIHITETGNHRLVQELNGRLDRATNEVNALNLRVGSNPILPRT